jgi:hypothetical protein
MRSQGTKDDGKPESRGRPRLIFRPLSRTGENPPYGILGETMETSASFEGRSAPSSYPTVEALVRIRAGGDQRWSSLPRQRSAKRWTNLLAQLSQLRGLKNGKWLVFNEEFSKVGTTIAVLVARSGPTPPGP